MYFVYAMYAGNYVKIGITSSIKRRIKQVQTGCPLSIHKVKYIKLPTRSESLILESKIHDLFKDYHTHGEWFLKGALSIQEYCIIFKDCYIVKIGHNQIDKSLDYLENLYVIMSMIDRDKKLKELNELKSFVSKTYDCNFIYKSKLYIIAKIDKQISIIVQYANKNKINAVKNKKAMEKFKSNHAWLYSNDDLEIDVNKTKG